MIINPMIPIWIMAIICILIIVFILYTDFSKIKRISSSKDNNKQLSRKRLFLIDMFIKIAIIILLFAVNLRIMLVDEDFEVSASSDIDVLFVIDTTLSMNAEDYNGNNPRIDGVISDCSYIINNLPGARYSIITFDNIARQIIPFTEDSDMAVAQIEALKVIDGGYANGTTINISYDAMENTLKSQDENKKTVVFFVSDGEITSSEDTKLKSFSALKKYVYDGAVLGYGTETGGKMIEYDFTSLYTSDDSTDYYYKGKKSEGIYYVKDRTNYTEALSKIDESNLKSIAKDLGIDYVRMNKQSDINNRLKQITTQIKLENSDDKEESFSDTYYYLEAIVFVFLCIHFVLIKKQIY